MEQKHPLCQYKDPLAAQCQEPALKDGLCFWHSPNADKSDKNLAQKLTEHAKSGGLMRGVCLQRCDLEGVDLVNHNQKHGYDFRYADFYRANLREAHLFNIDLRHASLMKADLCAANLNCASVEQANLLGAKWKNTKVENTCFGDNIVQENKALLARKKRNHDEANDLYQQSEEIYRDLRKHAEREGIFTLSGAFIQKELTMRRKQLPKFSLRRITSKLIDLFCGYGENPLRVVFFSIAFIFLCAVLYSFTGVAMAGNEIALSTRLSLTDNIGVFFSCLYYSVVTFTTLGYGDITPIGISRLIAAIEAFTGAFTIALFVVVFVKKMTR